MDDDEVVEGEEDCDTAGEADTCGNDEGREGEDDDVGVDEVNDDDCIGLEGEERAAVWDSSLVFSSAFRSL